MESEVQMVPIGELCDFLSGFAFKSEDLKGNSGIPVVKIKNVNNKVVTLEDMQFYPEDKLDSKVSRFLLSDGDVLIAMTGQGSVGRVGRLSKPKETKLLLNQRVGKFIPKKTVACLDYIYYVISSEKYENILFNAASGSGQPNLSPAIIKAIQIPFIPLKDQIVVSQILTKLDKKITLNRRINQTLEQMAQALFKSWFVDFDPVVDNALDAGFFEQDLEFSDELLRRAEARKAVRESANFKPLPEDIRQLFPAAFEECFESSLGLGGWMPEGWVYDCFSELLSSTIGGDWGKDSQDEKHTTQSRIVRGTDIPDLISGQLSNAPLRWVDPKKLQSRQIEAGDIIIEVSGGSPTQSTGRSIFMTQSMLNRLGGVVEPASFCRRFKPKSFCLGVLASLHLQAIYSDGKMWEYQNQSTGIANFQTKFFLEAERVLMPSDKVLENFCQIVTPLIEKSQNSEQVALAKLRDTLLPKLISGELCIGDSEVDTAEEVLA